MGISGVLGLMLVASGVLVLFLLRFVDVQQRPLLRGMALFQLFSGGVVVTAALLKLIP